jgi:hypothetical protein
MSPLSQEGQSTEFVIETTLFPAKFAGRVWKLIQPALTTSTPLAAQRFRKNRRNVGRSAAMLIVGVTSSNTARGRMKLSVIVS